MALSEVIDTGRFRNVESDLRLWKERRNLRMEQRNPWKEQRNLWVKRLPLWEHRRSSWQVLSNE
jgi:hypothetical protein